MDANQMQEDFNAAINFALEGADGEGMIFLSMWREGDWEALEREFPDFKVTDSLKRPWESFGEQVEPMVRVEQAERNLTAQLNYGGIFIDHQHTSRHITMEYEQGDLPDEIGQMRRLAEAFTELADAREAVRG